MLLSVAILLQKCLKQHGNKHKTAPIQACLHHRVPVNYFVVLVVFFVHGILNKIQGFSVEWRRRWGLHGVESGSCECRSLRQCVWVKQAYSGNPLHRHPSDEQQDEVQTDAHTRTLTQIKVVFFLCV